MTTTVNDILENLVPVGLGEPDGEQDVAVDLSALTDAEVLDLAVKASKGG